jgi:hypothetical protein
MNVQIKVLTKVVEEIQNTHQRKAEDRINVTGAVDIPKEIC